MEKISPANFGRLLTMRVAIVHDDLVQWGGAERILSGLCEIFPDAPIYTSVFDLSNEELFTRFGLKKIVTSFLQKIPGWRILYKVLLPFYSIAFEQFDFTNYDLVISNTTRFAKSIITKPSTRHICYCHTPPRFLWHFSGYGNFGFGEILMTKLRLFDQVSARRVDHFIAGSENARRRIKRVYGIECQVVYPFVDSGRFNDVETFDGGYFVAVGRPNKYKRFDLAKQACRMLGEELKIVDGSFSDEMVVKTLAGCKALVIAGEEDFGITSLEAQALGKPVIAYKEGGVLETVIEKKTGLFFTSSTVESLVEVLNRFNDLPAGKAGLNHWNKQNLIDNAKRFSKENFIRNFKQTVDDLLYTI